MKKLIEQVEGEGLEALLGESVAIFCANYIYAGVLTGVNESCILLSQPKIVYETGVLTASAWMDAQELPSPWYVQTSAIESFGKGK